MPRIVTPEQKRFRTELRRAITRGYDVVEGGTEHERPGPNFAGSFVLVQWGCGSNCMQAAIIDARDGTVLSPPQLPGMEKSASTFSLPTGSVDLRTLRFRTNSRLLGIPNVGDGKIYFFALNRHSWKFIGSEKAPDAL